jgi:hypothetical protein
MPPQMNERLDAAESVYFKRQLESIDKTVYETLYPGNKGRSLVPTVLDVAESAPAYLWRMTKRFGRAKIGGSLGDDAPRVDVAGEESSQVIKNVTDSYAYDFMEIREAARTGTNLDGMRAKAARDTIETAIDEILATGDTPSGLKGLLNQTTGGSGVGLYVLGDKAAGGAGVKTWSTATPNEIVKDVFGMATDLVKGLKQADAPGLSQFTLVLPVEQYTQIAQDRMGDASDKTILSFILTNSPYVKEIVPWYRCDGAGASGADRMVMFAKDPQVLGALVPMEFTAMPPQERNMQFVVNCIARTGGVIVRYPIAVRYADGL